ncbi:MAG: hypothetical protein QOD77_354 [Thermoplasmata archaeon]|jgi:hypothetical protein|nr:hypothetical protein [Thermoplasmata archaeon]
MVPQVLAFREEGAQVNSGPRTLSEQERKDLVLFLLSKRSIKPVDAKAEASDGGHSLLHTAMSILDAKLEKKGLDLGYDFNQYLLYPSDSRLNRDVFQLYHSELIENEDGEPERQLPIRHIEVTPAGKNHIRFFGVESSLARALAGKEIRLSEVTAIWQDLLSKPMAELLNLEIKARNREASMKEFEDAVSTLID